MHRHHRIRWKRRTIGVYGLGCTEWISPHRWGFCRQTAVSKARISIFPCLKSVAALGCQRCIYKLAGEDVDDPMEKRLWQAVAAYEETLFQKHGRAQQASDRSRVDQAFSKCLVFCRVLCDISRHFFAVGSGKLPITLRICLSAINKDRYVWVMSSTGQMALCGASWVNTR